MYWVIIKCDRSDFWMFFCAHVRWRLNGKMLLSGNLSIAAAANVNRLSDPSTSMIDGDLAQLALFMPG